MNGEQKPPVREMVKEAVQALGGDTTNVNVRDWILEHYPGTNRSTIQCQITYCTVNHDSRVHFAGVQQPRIANDERYDFLFRPSRGRVVWYDPSKHGIWKIVKTEDGSLAVAREGEALDKRESQALPQGTDEEGQVGFAAEDQLRDYLALNLDVIEEELQLYVDEYGNAGVEYNTPVGRIDLLCEDAAGGLVVVELKVGRSPDAAVGQLMRYMGWIKRHLAEGTPMRGIIVAHHASERLRYAVADIEPVTLKEYELQVTLSDVPPLDPDYGDRW